jgi:hypothetical protein
MPVLNIEIMLRYRAELQNLEDAADGFKDS